MPIESSKKISGFLKEITYTSQAPDAEGIPRFTTQLGTSKSRDGKPVWTNFKLYIQEPRLDHPLNIKLGLHNPNGKTLCQMEIEEFDELLYSIIQWRVKYDPQINELYKQEQRLAIRRKMKDKILSLLMNDDTELPTIQVNDEHLYDYFIDHYKQQCYLSIDKLIDSKDEKQRFSLISYIRKIIKMIPDNDIITDINDYLKLSLAEKGITAQSIGLDKSEKL